MTGYELSKEFESGLFEVWSAKHSQIYPELKSLYEAGLIDYQVEISGTVLEKKVYTITSDGEQMQIIADSSWRTDWHSIGSAWNGSRRIKTSLMESRLRMTKRSTTIWFC